MITAQQAYDITSTILCDEVDSIMRAIEIGITRGAKLGHYGIYYTAPEYTEGNILEEVSEKLLELGYSITDWDKTYLGWSTYIAWKQKGENDNDE
jgi:hypothetical protein